MSANASVIPSMWCEWKAWLTRSRLVSRPCAAQSRARSETAFSSPDTTTESGPLTAAMSSFAPLSASRVRTSSSVARTATMAPPAGSAWIRRPRAATRAQASGRDQTPAA